MKKLAPPKSWLFGEDMPILAAAALSFLLHSYSLFHYGYFTDELYYLDCANHLDWGYVDQPPLIGLVAWLIRRTLGDSLPAIRILPALAAAAAVVLTGRLARELGGGRVAQGLAALATAIAPGLLAVSHFLSMNAFEPLFWTGCALLIARVIKTGNARLWIWFGVLAGFGLQNKYSMAIFGFGLIAGLLLTPQRKLLASRWFWVGGVAACLIFLPNLAWNAVHGFPFLELQANIRASGRNVPMPPAAFWTQELITMLPLSAPVWLAGLWFFFFRKEGRPFRVLGWAFVAAAVIIMRFNPRVYYLYPAFPVLFAGGGVLLESLVRGPRLRWVKPVYATLMVAMSLAVAPTAIPLMPPETYIRYSAAIGLQQPRLETHQLGPLPQIFADQFGLREMAAEVARIYHALPADVRPRTAIFAQNYGQAGAVNLYRREFGLPEAISGHQSHFLWGPDGYTGESMIVLAGGRGRLQTLFAEVTRAGRVEHRYSMPYQHVDVYYCRGLRRPLSELWPQLKSWN